MKAGVLLVAIATLIVAFWVGYNVAMDVVKSKPVCHAAAEDAPITDCDYHDGGWWKK